MLFRLLLPLLSTVFTLVSACTVHSALYSPLIYTKYAQVATTQYQNPVLYPHVTTAGGQWRLVGADWWTTGFFPGSLYLLNTRSKRCPSGQNVDWLAQGRRWSNGLIGLQQGNTVGHDTGFLAYPFVEELAVNPTNQTAIKGINDFARLLANRYSPITGLTKSWDSSNPRDFLVIIDNMMNLEVLFISAELTGNNTLKDIAISHADKTMQNHLRPDGSSYHVVNYDSTTGTVIQKRTAQGYSNESTWTRGQAWGIYGFAMMYSRTKFPRYLDTARKMGKLFVSRIPSSGIVPWDFDAPASPVPPADTSAAALASSAFLMLSTLEKNNGNNTGAVWWADAALKLLADTSDFAASPNWWQAILTNGTSNNPANPPVRDTGLVYGDYYYIKAGNQLLDMGLASCRSSRVWSSDQSVLEGEAYQLESVAEPGPTGESDSLKLAKRRHRTRSHHKHRTPVDPVFPSF